MPQSLWPYLLCLVLPFIILVIIALSKEYGNGFGSIVKNSPIHELDDLINAIPKMHMDAKLRNTVHDITHAIGSDEEGNITLFYDGKRTSLSLSALEQLPNNFIKYSKNQWVNRHWVKTRKTDRLELLNGAQLSKEE
jgi:hypothetical protein